MRKLILLSIFVTLFLSTSVDAQDQPYQLHPTIGDTIDRQEIDKYLLFEMYSPESVDYFILSKNGNAYFLIVYSDNTIICRNHLSADEVLIQKEKVEKLNKYYASFIRDTEVLTTNDLKKELSDTLKVDLNMVTPTLLKSIKKDNRRKRWEEHRNDVRKNRENGMIY